MPFCSKFMSAVRKVMDSVDKVLGKTIEEITKYTKLIKDLGTAPEIQALLAIVDKGGKVNGWIETALGEITGITDSTQSLADKLKEWLDAAATEYDLNMRLQKLAAVASKVADEEAGNEPKKEHVYDGAVYARIIANK